MPNSISSLAGSLKHLVLSNNHLLEVPKMALRQLRELDHLNLNENNISTIRCDNGLYGIK
jgi:Leucine-rich repeat (LRR) protein